MHNLPTPSDSQVIWLQQGAPSKPAIGQACNGCGVCCTAAPYPVALVFLWQWRGACYALLCLVVGLDAADVSLWHGVAITVLWAFFSCLFIFCF